MKNFQTIDTQMGMQLLGLKYKNILTIFTKLEIILSILLTNRKDYGRLVGLPMQHFHDLYP